MIVPSPSVIAFSHSNIALVLQVLVAFEGVLMVLILAAFLMLKTQCHVQITTQLLIYCT